MRSYFRRADPFYDEQENHSLIGVANVFLESLFYDVKLQYGVPIINQKGEVTVFKSLVRPIYLAINVWLSLTPPLSCNALSAPDTCNAHCIELAPTSWIVAVQESGCIVVSTGMSLPMYWCLKLLMRTSGFSFFNVGVTPT